MYSKGFSLVAAAAAIGCATPALAGPIEGIVDNVGLPAVGEISPQDMIQQLEMYLLKSDVLMGELELGSVPEVRSIVTESDLLAELPGLSFPDMLDCQLDVPLVGELKSACMSVKPAVDTFFSKKMFALTDEGLGFLPESISVGSLKSVLDIEELTSLLDADILEAAKAKLESLGSTVDLASGLESFESISQEAMVKLETGIHTLEVVSGDAKAKLESGIGNLPEVAVGGMDAKLSGVVGPMKETGEQLVANLGQTTNDLVKKIEVTSGSLAGSTGSLTDQLEATTAELDSNVRDAVGRLRGSALAIPEMASLPNMQEKMAELIPEGVLPEVALPEVVLPEVTIHKVALPDVPVPKVTLPQVALPEVALPELSELKAAIPEKIGTIKTEVVVTLMEIKTNLIAKIDELKEKIPDIPSGAQVVAAIEGADLTLPSVEILDKIFAKGEASKLFVARETIERFLVAAKHMVGEVKHKVVEIKEKVGESVDIDISAKLDSNLGITI